MQKHVLPEVEKYMKQSKKRRTWTKIVSVLACVVVFCTTYALILPAITQENKVTCTLAEHKHDENCYKTIVTEKLICTKPEIVYHEHTDECYEIVETAAQAATSEANGSDEAAASQEETSHATEGGTAGQSSEENSSEISKENSKEDSEESAAESAIGTGTASGSDEATYQVQSGKESSTAEVVYEKVLICTKLEKEVHEHTETCYEKIESEPTLSCELQEHVHGLACYADLTADVENSAVWEQTFDDVELKGVWAEDVIAIAKTQLGYVESSKNYIVESKEEADGTIEETAKGYTRYGAWYGDAYGDWCAMFVSFCLDYADVEGMPLEAYCPTWIEKLSAEDVNLYHTTGAYIPEAGNLVFFDWDIDGESNHVGIVTAVNSNTEDGVMEIETIEGNSNNRVAAHTYPMTDETIMGFAALPYQLSEEEQAEVDRVIAMIDAMPSADEIDAKVEEFYEAEDEDGEIAYLEKTYQQVARVYHYYSELSDVQKEHVTNADKLLELEYIWLVTPYAITQGIDVYQINSYPDGSTDDASTETVLFKGKSADEYGITTMNFGWWTAIIVEENEDGLLYVSRVDKTRELDKSAYGPTTENGFVLLVFSGKLPFEQVAIKVGDAVSVPFDYSQTLAYTGSNLGTVTFASGSFKEDKDNSSKLTIVPSADTDELIEVNLYDYDTRINDPYNTDKKYPGFQQDNGTTSIGTELLLYSFNFGNNITSDLAAGITNVTNQGGDINATAESYTDSNGNVVDVGVVNVPIEGAISKTLINGFPALADETTDLKYLFTPNGGYGKQVNTANINGLFKHNATTGAYAFNSRENHAQFDDITNTFTLYEQMISSNYIMYPFGNFLPFNDIVHQSMQASRIDRDYFLDIAESAEYRYNQGQGDEYNTLSTVLTKFVSLMDVSDYGSNWDAYDAINAYFTKAKIPQQFSDTSPTLPNGKPVLDYIYSIDYDEATNFYFGMDMKMNFMQPKDGLTGKDNGNNSTGTWEMNTAGDYYLTGEADGISDYPMVFNFTGDDDVWIFVDGVLFLDLSGIHRHVGGRINFATGEISYYHLDVTKGDVSDTPYKVVTFEEAFRAAYAADSAELEKALAGLNEKGTFKNYTSHSLNFYYMERGAGSGVCRMNFNFPLLKKNSISVQKEVSADTEILGDPDYKFQILKANSDGTKTDNLFITANTSYTIYDATGTKVGTGTTDANGMFTLKAGQRAEFAGIEENAGKYYVRELLEGAIQEQYGNVTVSGESTTKSNNVMVGSDTFTGMESSVKDMSDGITTFRFINDVDEQKFGKLSISKKLTEYLQTRDVKKFDIEVFLDGETLPVGTEYTVGDETRVVTTAGIITIAADETATLSNILAGTEFTVKEASESAEGYTVTYTEPKGDTVTVNDGAATGIIKTNTEVNLVVTNSEKGTTITIPGTKILANPDGKNHTFIFDLTEVTDYTGKTEKEGGLSGYQATAVVNSEGSVGFGFNINYVLADLGSLPQVFYYRIMEKASEEALANPTVYVVGVTISEIGDSVTAEITDMWKNGEKVERLSADFINTLAGDLTISKQVVADEETQRTDEFEFITTLSPKESGEISYTATLNYANGASEEASVKFVDGTATIHLKHGDSLTIHDIPYGTEWTVTETNADGYSTTNKIGDQTNEGVLTEGNIVTGTTTVIYTNTAGYVLPESGESGTTLYTMAGLMLVLCSAAFLLYRYQKRRREAK